MASAAERTSYSWPSNSRRTALPGVSSRLSSAAVGWCCSDADCEEVEAPDVSLDECDKAPAVNALPAAKRKSTTCAWLMGGSSGGKSSTGSSRDTQSHFAPERSKRRRLESVQDVS